MGAGKGKNRRMQLNLKRKGKGLENGDHSFLLDFEHGGTLKAFSDYLVKEGFQLEIKYMAPNQDNEIARKFEDLGYEDFDGLSMSTWPNIDFSKKKVDIILSKRFTTEDSAFVTLAYAAAAHNLDKNYRKVMVEKDSKVLLHILFKNLLKDPWIFKGSPPYHDGVSIALVDPLACHLSRHNIAIPDDRNGACPRNLADKVPIGESAITLCAGSAMDRNPGHSGISGGLHHFLDVDRSFIPARSDLNRKRNS